MHKLVSFKKKFILQLQKKRVNTMTPVEIFSVKLT